jgi:hypothetical protein
MVRLQTWGRDIEDKDQDLDLRKLHNDSLE